MALKILAVIVSIMIIAIVLTAFISETQIYKFLDGNGFLDVTEIFIFVSAGLIAIRMFQLKKFGWCFVLLIVALLSNPIHTFIYQKLAWATLELTCAGIFIASIFALKEPSTN